jgi:hypothetical protein
LVKELSRRASSLTIWWLIRVLAGIAEEKVWWAAPAAVDSGTTRLDFASWLKTLSTRDRRIAETLDISETTGRVARMFPLFAGRVSQFRGEFWENWPRFVGELVGPGGLRLRGNDRLTPFRQKT